MRDGGVAPNPRTTAGIAALLALLVILLVPGQARAAPEGQTLEISVVGSQTIVSATGCNWPEGEEYGPGSWVEVTVATWFAGGGRASAPVTIGQASIEPTPAGGWQYTVPRAPLAAVPTWATEVVLGVQAHCGQAIGNGFDYEAASSRRAIVRPLRPATTTTGAVGPVQASAAEPVAGVASFTG